MTLSDGTWLLQAFLIFALEFIPISFSYASSGDWTAVISEEANTYSFSLLPPFST